MGLQPDWLPEKAAHPRSMAVFKVRRTSAFLSDNLHLSPHFRWENASELLSLWGLPSLLQVQIRRALTEDVCGGAAWSR